jgi:hypothetical protein
MLKIIFIAITTFLSFSAQSLTFINNYESNQNAVIQKSQQTSKSIFISDEDYNRFNQIPAEKKIQSCGFEYFEPNWRQIDKDLAPRIRGFNSKMDNEDFVEGSNSRRVLRKYLAAITFAMVSEDLELKEKLFDKLHQWASQDSLSATKQCYSSTPPSILRSCRGDWSDPDGQDIAPVRDATVALEIVMSLNYVYKLYYSDYQLQDKRHKVIKEWFKSFYHRIARSYKFFFGNSAGWNFPNIAIKHGKNRNYKDMVKKMVKGLDKWTLDDGSMKNRTTRGNRALWYHHTAIGEAFIILEIARTANVEISSELENKLIKAVELFHDAYLDHSVIEPWASQKHNAQASHGYQNFNDIEYSTVYSAWFHIFQMRYPEHRTAKWLKKELSNEAKSLKSNTITGVNLACIHKALADN